MAAQQPVACDAACVALMGFGAGASVRVRDVFARTDNGTFAAADGYSALVPPNGTVLVRLTAA